MTTENGKTTESSVDLSALEAVVQQGLTQIKSVYQLLPEFVRTPADGAKMMRSARSYSDEFLEASAVATEDDATIQATTGLDAARARLVVARNLRFEPLAAAAEALARDIRYNMCRERWDVVQQALQVYNLAKGFTRNARAGALVAHVRTMKSAIGRSGNRGKLKTAPAPQPVPQSSEV
jgi:hypothetical protein